MNKKVIIFIVVLISILIFTTLINKINQLENSLSLSRNNEKALINENDTLSNTNIVYKLKVDQLGYFNDSISKKMLDIQRILKIKDNKIKSMEYLLSIAVKTDSIIFRDTIFKKNLSIDTTLEDKWYKLNIKLKYPNKITITPQFVIEEYIITHDKKETVLPPKKFFIARWFQKKHTIRIVDVYRESPYIKDKKKRFIEIVK